MKTFKTSFIGLFLFVVAACSTVKKLVTEKRSLLQKVESKDFIVYVTRCLPTDLVNTSFNSDVVLKVKKDTAYANLPFHGLMTVNPMDMTTGPITFNGPMREYTMSQNSSKGWSILFKVDSAPYTYQVAIEISNNGKAVFKVTSTKRTTMTYFGDTD
jgi:hypothetical protein